MESFLYTELTNILEDLEYENLTPKDRREPNGAFAILGILDEWIKSKIFA